MVKRIFFLQALITLVLGFYISSLGMSSDEISGFKLTGQEILNFPGETNEDFQESEIIKNPNPYWKIFGLAITILSIFELSFLGASSFKD